MILEKFQKLSNATILDNKALKSVKGGEYGDIDWDFWRRYFFGNAGNYAGFSATQMAAIYAEVQKELGR